MYILYLIKQAIDIIRNKLLYVANIYIYCLSYNIYLFDMNIFYIINIQIIFLRSFNEYFNTYVWLIFTTYHF